MAEEIKNQGQQEYAENISGQAKEIISAALEETKNNGTSPVLGDPNVTDNFKGLPMRELIAIMHIWCRHESIDTRVIYIHVCGCVAPYKFCKFASFSPPLIILQKDNYTYSIRFRRQK